MAFFGALLIEERRCSSMAAFTDGSMVISQASASLLMSREPSGMAAKGISASLPSGTMNNRFLPATSAKGAGRGYRPEPLVSGEAAPVFDAGAWLSIRCRKPAAPFLVNVLPGRQNRYDRNVLSLIAHI